MNAETVESVTTECPNGHRVRGDLGWLRRFVRCPHCEAQFRFDRPESSAAVVTAVSSPPPIEPRSLSDTGVMRIIDAFGKPVVPVDDGRTRHCSQCGGEFPSSISVCYGCNVELDAPRPVAAPRTSVDPSPGKAESIDFQPVNPFPFLDLVVRKVMRPRKSIVALDCSDSWDTVVDQVREADHTVFPVCNRSLDDLIGTVTCNQILLANAQQFDLRSLTQSVETITESTPVSEVLSRLERCQRTFAVVVDEYETVVGMVTVKDIMGKLVRT